MQTDFNIVVLISGRGSNLKSIIDNAKHYRVKAVISNNPEAAGLDYARQSGIPALSLKRSDYPSLGEFKRAIMNEVIQQSPLLVALAGFMQVLPPEFIEAFPNRIINIHPALLPAFPGLDTHQRALAAGVDEHGCTVHVVDCGVDSGPVIAQATLNVPPDEDERSLAARVLELEHKLYPWVLNSIGKDAISLVGRSPKYSLESRREASTAGFLLAADDA